MMTWIIFAAAERDAANAKYMLEQKLKGIMNRLRARIERAPLYRAFSSMRTAVAYLKIEEMNERIRLEKVTLLTKQVCCACTATRRTSRSRVSPTRLAGALRRHSERCATSSSRRRWANGSGISPSF